MISTAFIILDLLVKMKAPSSTYSRLFSNRRVGTSISASSQLSSRVSAKFASPCLTDSYGVGDRSGGRFANFENRS
eukprot:scaffold421275_cov58-Attheya_sp.AAC.2